MEYLTEERLNRVRGCMIGGAVGDALGYEVEFDDILEIRNRYGTHGITRYQLQHDGLAWISDDTQMCLFTANGLLYANTQQMMREYQRKVIDDIALAYTEWYETQTTD
jgi:ADP-ribosylglycohydrolase